MRYIRITFCSACFLTLLFTATAWGQQYVLSVPSEYSSIQAALGQAGNLIHGIPSGPIPGDVLIQVSPGTYTESLDLNGINSPVFRVTLHAVEGQSRTIIDSSPIGNHVLKGTGVNNFTLDGFTVRNRYDVLGDLCCSQGMNLRNSTHITVQNCFFDTTYVAMNFPIADPNYSSEVTVVHNTTIGGNGTDWSAENFLTGQAVNMTYSTSDPATIPIGDHKLIVADNVFRCNGSAVRYQMTKTDANGNLIGAFPNGTLVMTGNDVRNYYGAGHNNIGGHDHIIAGNRFHDSTIGAGAQLNGIAGGIIENNLYINNGHGLLILDSPVISDRTFGDLLVRHNTFVNNLGAGIIYESYRADGVTKVIPIIYNNIVAYNGASGIAAVGNSSGTPSFIPIDFHLERNDVFGNTLKNLTMPNVWYDFTRISNLGVATKNYAGAMNTSLDLSVNPGFTNLQGGDFSLTKGSHLVNKGITSRSIPSSDFAKALRDSVPDIGAFEYIGAK
jgi:hypothetical protein